MNTTDKLITSLGRHKESIAKIKITGGTGNIFVNNNPVDQSKISPICLSPLKITGLMDKINLYIKVSGGGVIGQSKAIRLGLSRAILKFDSEFKTTLKKLGFLKRDPRSRERKKYGLKSARRSPQWSKR